MEKEESKNDCEGLTARDVVARKKFKVSSEKHIFGIMAAAPLPPKPIVQVPDDIPDVDELENHSAVNPDGDISSNLRGEHDITSNFKGSKK